MAFFLSQNGIFQFLHLSIEPHFWTVSPLTFIQWKAVTVQQTVLFAILRRTTPKRFVRIKRKGCRRTGVQQPLYVVHVKTYRTGKVLHLLDF